MRHPPSSIGWSPAIRRLGAAVMVLGLAADAMTHLLAEHAYDLAAAGFTPGEHLAHVEVFAGMVLVLAGVIAQGLEASRSRPVRQERSSSHAVR